MGGGSASGASDAVAMPSVSSISISGAAEGDFATAKTSVWWDIENCQVPRGCDAHVIAKNISTALANMGYKGMVSSISAYGDTNKINPTVQQALNSTGVSLNHVPAGVKDASDKKILVDMLLWALDNPPPANYLLISGDRDFSNALHQLRFRRYNILLAHAPNVSSALVAAAQCVWQWTNLLNGGPPMNNESSKTTESPGPLKGKQNGKAVTNMKHPSVGVNESSNGFPGNFGLNTTQMIHQAAQFSSHQKSLDNPDSAYMGNSFGYCLPPNSNGSSVGTNMVKGAPHEFFNPNISCSPNHRPNSIPSSMTPNLHPSSHQIRSLLRPSDLQSSNPMMPSDRMQTSHAYNTTPFPQSSVHDGSFSAAFATANLSVPDISRLNISNRSYGDNYGTRPYQQDFRPSNNVPPFPTKPEFRPSLPEFRPPSTSGGNINSNGVGMPAFPEITPEVQFSIGVILRALHALRTDKMTPTESNIADCIHYGKINIPNFNVKFGLDHAIRNNCVVKLGTGASLLLYVGKNDTLWNCVNIMDLNAKHPKTTWDAVQSFISSSTGRYKLHATECRYQAALVLQTSCLKDATIGDALQILNLVINNKKWIVPHLSGWQPLAIKLPMTV